MQNLKTTEKKDPWLMSSHRKKHKKNIKCFFFGLWTSFNTVFEDDDDDEIGNTS